MIGLDIVDLRRIKLKPSLIHYILTPEERLEFEKKHTDHQRIEYLGGRFAAKEAVFKATQDPLYLHYSILNAENGAPYIKDHPELHVSISHDGDMAAAVVLVR